MGAKDIYIQLRAAGLTAEGACGLMGNMQAESAMRANIAQRGMTALTDEEYTRRADAGELDFACDAVGYGLCQWTFHTRKRALLDFARACGTSVGDEKLQVEFCLRELRQDYPALSDFLRKTDSSYEAAARVCHEYERPAVNNIEQRTFFALNIADQARAEGWGNCAESDGAQAGQTDDLKATLTNESVMHLQAILVTCGYNIGTQANATGIDGYIGKKTVAALKDFAARLEAMV